MLNAIPGMHCVAPQAAFYVLPSVSLPPGHTDEQFVLALLRETGILCVHGSGFGMPPEQGFFRIVFLAAPEELASIYGDIGTFTRTYLARA
jgi:alanine-synthesizing transaminase